MDEHAAALGEHGTAALGAGEQGRLGEGLGFDGSVTESCRPDQAGPGRLSGRRVEQMVCVAAALVAPDPHVEAGGGDGAGAELEHEGALAGEGMLDEDLVGGDECVGAADADVAAAVDDEARVATQPLGDQVGGQPLAGTTGVKADAGRPLDRAGRVVDREATPVRGRVGMRRVPRWRLGQGRTQRCTRYPGSRGDVAGGFDLSNQGWVDQTAAALGGFEAGLDRGAQ